MVELIIALAILALLAGVTSLAVTSLGSNEDPGLDALLHQARAEAVRTGHSVKLMVDTAGSAGPRAILILPDGSVLGQSDSMPGQQP
jgi:Tfp pilus assembly protein FimT